MSFFPVMNRNAEKTSRMMVSQEEKLRMGSVSPSKSGKPRFPKPKAPWRHEGSEPHATSIAMEETRRDRVASAPQERAPGTYQFTAATIDAILAGSRADVVMSRLGTTPQETEAIKVTRAAALEKLKALETAHSKVIPGANGGYVEIAPFADESQRWQAEMEQELRKVFPDDRAVLLARMIANEHNDQNASAYRRELHVEPSPENPSRILLHEKLFDANGQTIDSDFEIVSGRSRNRWGHLLEFD